MAKKKSKRVCRGCGAAERVDRLGYTNIAPFLGYCMDCINRALRK